MRILKTGKPTHKERAIDAALRKKPVRLSIEIPADLHKRLKLKAVEDNTTIKEFTLKCVIKGLNN